MNMQNLLKDVRETSRLYQSIKGCGCQFHYVTLTKEELNDRTKLNTNHVSEAVYKPVPDKYVCEKERLWRRYVRLRDEYIKNYSKAKAS
jgi:hypothetical protein